MSVILKQRMLIDGKVIIVTVVRVSDLVYHYTRITKTLNLERSDAYEMKHYDKMIEIDFKFTVGPGLTNDEIIKKGHEISNQSHVKAAL